jgi:MarR family transcriptional regulator, lower aerobic nicotinate degradation pathway regulator
MSTTSEADTTGLDPVLAAALNQELSRHARILHGLKSRTATLLPEGLDMAAFGLLLALVHCGPRRQGELAELSLLDPSTVSRHVAQLARAGYVQRRPDPQDGRAVQLVATDDGERIAHEIGERRQAVICDALRAWAPDDARQLAALLRRLNDDLDAVRPHRGRLLVGRPQEGTPQPPPEPASAAPDQLPDPRTPVQENA